MIHNVTVSLALLLMPFVAHAQADNADKLVSVIQLQPSMRSVTVPQLPRSAPPPPRAAPASARAVRRAEQSLATPAQPSARPVVILERTFDFERLNIQDDLLLPSVREGLQLRQTAESTPP